MRILLCHNYYQSPGGEDQVFVDETRLLESHGHEAIRFTVHNDAIREMGRLEVARRTLWNRESYRQLRESIQGTRPAVMHCTNTFPLISPSAYYAAKAEGVPVVQSLHNYRLFCAAATFLRDGRPCEDCIGKRIPWPGVVHRCYRNSRPASAVVVSMQALHRVKNTWTCMVDRYIALSEFSRRKFIEAGLPADRIAVKPNFIDPDPGLRAGRSKYAVYVGRLSVEKGIDTLLAAWERPGMKLPLKIVGDGPLAGQVRSAASNGHDIQYVGRQSGDDVMAIVGDATCLVLPSRCYENCPKTVLEAYALGTPVIASGHGALTEMIEHDRTGLHFAPADPNDLAAKVGQLLSDPVRLEQMRRATRAEYEDKYMAESNHRSLMAIYEKAVENSGGAEHGKKVRSVHRHSSRIPGNTVSAG